MHASSCVPNAGSGRFASAQSARWQVLGGDLLRLLQRLLDRLQERALDQPDPRLDVRERLQVARRAAHRGLDRDAGVGVLAQSRAERLERRRADRAVLHVDLDQHAHVGRRLQQLVQVTGADRGVQADAELGELDRHRGARRVLRDGADGVDVGLDRGRGLRQVVDGLAEQVEADVDPLGPQLAGDGDRLLQRGAGDEAADEPARQPAGAHQLLETLVRGCDEEQTLDH